MSPGRTSEATLSPCTLTMLLPVRSSAACGFVSGAGSAGCDSPFPIAMGLRRSGARPWPRLPELSCAAALDADLALGHLSCSQLAHSHLPCLTTWLLC